MNAFEQPQIDKMVFRKTNAQAGRHTSVTPKNSTNVHLSYGRIILNASVPSVMFGTENQETGLICLSGDANVAVGDERFRLSQYDSIYVPRGSQITVTTTSSVDLAEFSADVEGRYPIQFVPYREVEKNASLKFQTGGPASARVINISAGQERECRTITRRFYDLRIGQLDELAATRTRKNARRDVRVLQHAGAGVRNPVRL